MPRIAVGQWAPDSAGVDATVLFEATNVFPNASGYGPVRGLSTASSALPANAKGGVGVQRSDLSWDFYAGTATKLYKFNAGAGGLDGRLEPDDGLCGAGRRVLVLLHGR
jgi:hypothetical protein